MAVAGGRSVGPWLPQCRRGGGGGRVCATPLEPQPPSAASNTQSSIKDSTWLRGQQGQQSRQQRGGQAATSSWQWQGHSSRPPQHRAPQHQRQQQEQRRQWRQEQAARICNTNHTHTSQQRRLLLALRHDLTTPTDSDREDEWVPAAARNSATGSVTAARLPRASRSTFFANSNTAGQNMLAKGYFLEKLRVSGCVDENGQPTELGRQRGVGFSSYMNVGINKLLAQSTDVATLFSIIRDVGYLMDAINACTTMHRLGKVVRRQRDVTPGIVQEVVQHPLYKQHIRRVEELLPTILPRGLANAMWGLAALGDIEHLDLARQLAEAVSKQRAEEFQPQELSNVVWAMGTLGVLHEEALDCVLMVAVRQIDRFIPQALSNMVWACAHLRNGTRGCLGPTGGGLPATSTAKDSRPGWQPPPAFLQAVATAATGQMSEFQSQTLSNLLWGYCKLDVYPQDLFEAAAVELVDRFRIPELARQFRAQELSNSLYAFAQGNIINEQLLEAYERELSATWLEIDSTGQERRVSRLDDFTSQALANTLWSFANLRWYPVRLLEPITRAVGRKMHIMSTQEISNSIWSYAKFAYHPGPVMSQYQAEIARRIQQFDGQSLTTTMWAMAALSATHCDGFVKLLQRFVQLERHGGFQDVQYNQVLQAVLLAQFEMQRQPGEFRQDIDLPDDIVDRALLAWQTQQQAAKLSSFQLEVSDALGRLGIEHELEYLTAVNLLSVDIAIIKGGKKIAIEVDGPFHFSVNTSSPLGQTMIRRRLLRAVGWTVISVPYHAWYKLPLEERPVYLSRLLVRKDGSFHDQIMQVSEDLLSTEFKKGLGNEAGVDAFQEEDEHRPARLIPRNLGQLLERQGLMLTRSAARRLVDMGFAEQVSLDEGDGQEPTSVYHARRQTRAQGSSTSSSSAAAAAANLPAAVVAESRSVAQASTGTDDESSTFLDAIIEAAQAEHVGVGWGENSPAAAPIPGPADTTSSGGADTTSTAANGWGEPGHDLMPRPLQVDEDDRDNRFRPRYTDFEGNVLEGAEPFYLNLLQQTPPRRLSPSSQTQPSAGMAPTGQAAGLSQSGKAVGRRTDGGGSLIQQPARRNPMARQQAPERQLSHSQQQQQPRRLSAVEQRRSFRADARGGHGNQQRASTAETSETGLTGPGATPSVSTDGSQTVRQLRAPLHRHSALPWQVAPAAGTSPAAGVLEITNQRPPSSSATVRQQSVKRGKAIVLGPRKQHARGSVHNQVFDKQVNQQVQLPNQDPK